MKLLYNIPAAAIFALLTASQGSSFTAPTHIWGTSRQLKTGTVLNAAKGGSSSDGSRARDHFQARTCVKHFLTQRAVQSFMFLLGEVRDPHTAGWVEDFAGANNLLDFHGTGAFNVSRFESWDSLLLDMMEEPEDELIIETVRRSPKAGNWNKMNLLRQQGKLQESENVTESNPHLEEEIVELVIDIDPPSLVSRMISVREQLSKEWVEDLDVVFEHNEMLLDQYQEHVMNVRNQEQVDATDTDTNADADAVSNEENRNVTNSDVASSEEKVDAATITSAKDDNEEEKEEGGIYLADEGASDLGDYSTEYSPTSKKKFFEHVGLHMLTSHQSFQGFASSPLRKGTFDLLILLATQESIHRLLREYQQDGKARYVSYEWLRDFYIERVEEYFDGNQRYGRADEFLEELLVTSPSMIYTKDGKADLIDPHGIAESIILSRGEVLLDWKKIVSKVPADHTNLRKALLERQMEKLMPTTTSAEDDCEHVEHIEEVIEGEFE